MVLFWCFDSLFVYNCYKLKRRECFGPSNVLMDQNTNHLRTENSRENRKITYKSKHCRKKKTLLYVPTLYTYRRCRIFHLNKKIINHKTYIISFFYDGSHRR